MTEHMASAIEVGKILDEWDPEADPTELLTKIAEFVEKETEAYLKMDPDPFDDRHPSRAKPECGLGNLLKVIFKHEEFMSKLVSHYCSAKNDPKLHTAALRLLVGLLPGLETSVVFQETEGLVDTLLEMVESSDEPRQSYAIGLLAAAMEIQDIALNYKEQNMRLVPLLLKRLRDLAGQPKKDPTLEPVPKRRRISSPERSESNSSWAELEPLIVGSFRLHPLTKEMQQRFILQYLTPMGDYQELLINIFEEDALGLILHYLDLTINRDVRLAFEALKYLSTLLCHKKIALEFLNLEGLQILLQIPRPSVAATGVSICLYYLAYSEDAMERICSLPRDLIEELVQYVLWLLECSHDSSRCHATMFFCCSFAFRVVLDLFDAQDGLRKLLNSMFRLNIFEHEVNDDDDPSSDQADEAIQKMQTARHVCVALKKYCEAHLIIESERKKGSKVSQHHSCKAIRCSVETINEHVQLLAELTPTTWKPVDDLVKLGGVKLLVSLVAACTSGTWTFNGKGDALKSALDALVVATIVPKGQLILRERIPLEDGRMGSGMGVIIKCLESPEMLEEVNESSLSALRIVINCVRPVNKVASSKPSNSQSLTNTTSSSNVISRRKSGHHLNVSLPSQTATSSSTASTTTSNHNSAPTASSSSSSATANGPISSSSSLSLLEHKTIMWKCVKDNDGLPLLLNLLNISRPILLADSIRALAAKALCYLAHFGPVKQIIAKLPIFTNNQLQSLMKEPITQDRRAEHAAFCKSCVELIHLVTGAPVNSTASGTTLDSTSLESISKQEIVTQTKIEFHKKQLLQLMYDFLVKNGLTGTASMLHKEADLTASVPRLLPTAWPQRGASSGSSGGGGFTCYTPPSYHSFRSPLGRWQAKSSSIQKPQVASRLHNNCYMPSPVLKKTPKGVTLDSIVTEYLRTQHALCRNPIVTCPPFDLFQPHKCPEPHNTRVVPLNVALRIQCRQMNPPFGGYGGQKADRSFVFSRFRAIRTIKEDSQSFTACAISISDHFLFLGTESGEMATYNMESGSLVATYNCHDSYVTNIEPSRDGRAILTCSAQYRGPMSILWSFTDVFDMKMNFNDDSHVEFGKFVQDKVIGTNGSVATLYDLNVLKKLDTFHDESITKGYFRNRATFNYTDELILNDGVLWDVRSREVVHKFDKFNNFINGVFHPNGWEIIANSEVWDMRNYRLIRTVPALDQCRVKFNATGDVIFGTMFEQDEQIEDEQKSPYGSSFRTFHASDYSNIATIDVRRTIFDLAIDPGDNLIAVVENNAKDETATESVCRLYEIGRGRESDDEGQEDEDEDQEDLDEDDDDDSSDWDDPNDYTDGLAPIGDSSDFLDSDDSSDGSLTYGASTDYYGSDDDEGDEDDDDEDEDEDDDDDDSSGTEEVSSFNSSHNGDDDVADEAS